MLHESLYRSKQAITLKELLFWGYISLVSGLFGCPFLLESLLEH